MDACFNTVLDTMPEAVVVCNRKVTITYANSAARSDRTSRTVLRGTAPLLERLFEAVPLGIAVLEGPDYRHVLVNALYRERIVARGKEVLGRTVAEVFPCRAASLVPALDEVRRTGEPYRIVDLPHQAATDPSPAGRRSFSYSFWPLPRPGDETGSLLALIQETTKPPPSGAIPVVGDERRLAEVVQNLLSNAIKYSARGSPVVVETVLSDGNILVRVLDRGIGIPADQLEQVFAGFYRATNLTGRQPGGLGLGLYISRDIVRRHGGELWAENREGGGTAMCLRLPLAGAGAAARPAGDDAIPGVTGSEASN